MKITGIICEYNPLHLGHKKQFDRIRAENPDCGIVCLMSGNFVQRGEPAIFDKTARAQAAILSGADLVLEMPVTASLSSAEGFAAKGVAVLGAFCDELSFGAEHPRKDLLLATAGVLLSEEFKLALRTELDTGISFPAARQKALQALGADDSLICSPNDILAVEYCKAILSQKCKMTPSPIQREGNYHDNTPDPENPSATSLRKCITEGGEWERYVPEQCRPVFKNACTHSLGYAERAILGKLRTMTDEEFEALPYGSEGLWRKLMHAARKCATLEEVFETVKSKRYTRTRLNRMVMCAFLGITEDILNSPAPYVRVLALNDRGREILKAAREYGSFLNAGQKADDPYQLLENRWGDLYGLFCDQPEPAGVEATRRIVYVK